MNMSSAVMRRAEISFQDIPAGVLEERAPGKQYAFTYLEDYAGPMISLTLPVRKEEYLFGAFPPFFDGLLPEGVQLEALLRQNKIDRNDHFAQLTAVGMDLVGAVTAKEIL
jgi:serine/threonine-protein kinase HipA